MFDKNVDGDENDDDEDEDDDDLLGRKGKQKYETTWCRRRRGSPSETRSSPQAREHTRAYIHTQTVVVVVVVVVGVPAGVVGRVITNFDDVVRKVGKRERGTEGREGSILSSIFCFCSDDDVIVRGALVVTWYYLVGYQDPKGFDSTLFERSSGR